MALADLVPAGVVVVTGRLDDPRWAAAVPATEAGLVAGRPSLRRRDFVAGRGCARLALARLGVGEVAVIGVRDDRGPDWPDGVTGSVAHGAGEAAAAVVRRTTLAGLGVDVEDARPLDDATAAVVTGPAERAAASRCGLGAVGPTVVLSAKEALFKAWAPGHGWLEPDQATVLLRPDGTWTATVDPTGLPVAGGWEVDGGVVRTAAWVA